MVLSLPSRKCVGVSCPKVTRELHDECLVSVHGESVLKLSLKFFMSLHVCLVIPLSLHGACMSEYGEFRLAESVR